MNVYGVLTGTLTSNKTVTGVLSVPSAANVTRYEGPYEFTPTADTQTIEIEHEMATQNITINPIPSNWGLITWNGAVLTVS